MLLLMLPLVVVVVLDASGSGDGGALEVFSSCCCCWLCCSCKLAPAGNSRKDVGVMHKQNVVRERKKKRAKIRMKIVSSLMCIALDRRKLVAASSSSCCSTSTNSNICGVGFVCGFSPQQRIQV